MFTDLPLPTLIGFIVVLVLSLSWHEAAHAWVADRLGDPTARERGRVTLNPLKHLDPFLSILLPLILYLAGGFVFGGAKPVPIDVRNFKHRARDFMLVAIAGPLSNVLLAACFGLFFAICVWLGIFPVEHIPNPFGPATPSIPSIIFDIDPRIPSRFWLQMGLQINLILAMFNLIPIPPLDGSRIIGWLLPRPVQPAWYRLDRIGMLVVFGLVILLQKGGGMAYIENFLTSVWYEAGSAVDNLVRLGVAT